MNNDTQQREIGWVELNSGMYYRCVCGQTFDADFMARDGHDVAGCGYDPYDDPAGGE